jgi:threonine dehydratase
MMRPTAQGVERAAELLSSYFPPTPLVRSELLSRVFDADVWLKNETVSPIASFKLRGALTALVRAKALGQLEGAVTASTGNHGQGVAYAARSLGIPAHVFLPASSNPSKRAMLLGLGASVHEAGTDIDGAKDAARSFAAERNSFFVDDGESSDVIEGAGTVGLEIARALARCDACFVPMGSGSLAAGCALSLKAQGSRTRLFAVQSERAPAMAESHRTGHAISRPVATLAEGLECREPAKLALACLIEWVDEALVVSDDELLSATRTLVEKAHLLAEPSGAAGLAGAFRKRAALAGRIVVVVVSGANVTTELLSRALAAPALA